MLVSVVIPCFCSEATIEKVVHLTKAQLASAGYEYEFILVNDGSSDDTFSCIEKLCGADSRVVGIDCAKNLGQHSALMAGMRRARGSVVMLMDDDMQTPPSQCTLLVETLLQNDVDVVFAEWSNKKQKAWRRAMSRAATWVSYKLVERPEGVIWCNFCVMRDYICDEVVRYDGPFISIMGLINRATFNTMNVAVEQNKREFGESGYSFKTLLRLWGATLDFSIVPLRAASLLGAAVGVAGLIGALLVVIGKLTNPAMSVGWPSLMVVVLICSSFVFLTLGIIGEYIGRIFMTLNNSPQYVVKREIDRRPGNEC